MDSSGHCYSSRSACQSCCSSIGTKYLILSFDTRKVQGIADDTKALCEGSSEEEEAERVQEKIDGYIQQIKWQFIGFQVCRSVSIFH